MNNRLGSLVLGLCLILSSPAVAQDFGAFSMDVPKGWIASTEEGGAVAVIAPNNEAAVTIGSEKLEGVNPDEGARILSRKLGGSEPQKTADGEYSFHFTRNGITSRSIFRARKDHFILITVTDSTGKHQEAIDAMLESFKEK